MTLPAITPRFAALGEPYSLPIPARPLPTPTLLHVNSALARELGVDPADSASPSFAAIMAGNAPWPDYDARASVYAGHQFGHFVPQLGDGRALSIAEIRDAAGQPQELQLKGAGPTPYSRGSDGRAVLRSSIREYLCSEAMHALGIPTTRALALVGSPQPVRRETIETAAVVCRVAPSFIRFGHFEFWYYRREHERLAPLADQLIAQHFPEFDGHPDRHALWLTEVVERTARLIAGWQAVGFCHGVMNTDNFSALGLTIDYGPFGFLDAFDPHHICNHTDQGGRYAWDRQPMIGHWNCTKLLQACLPLLGDTPEAAVARAQPIADRYPVTYSAAMTARWAAKLGLRAFRDGDETLVNRWLALLASSKADFTRSWRHLARIKALDDGPGTGVREEILDLAAFDAWLPDYRARLRSEQSDDAERAARMNAANPKYVLRNHLAQAAIARAETGDYSEIDRLFTLLSQPFAEQPEHETYAAEPPPEARHIEVSCSS
ncbi:YdiU family protein [Nevskia sp.]|uniref:protein adenylyltransferase SelO n=1 Tax=Nevskia sp. TaxID=1929292 RepID=UPI0025F1FD99|nr:YdiU family protein [Nevskia sp.]